ncbi:hypothetical protein [Haloarcula amylovorans]|uniref:hypothetical protein n=1 Tax=Haloarcula amylovorans TaxID=2562280 RepID=UPI0010762973|nr:hypothetical protein [Halomicroarcula amylolytica]
MSSDGNPIQQDRTAEETTLQLGPSRRWGATYEWPGVVVLFAILATLWSLDGRLGVAAWLAIVVSWVVFPPIVAVAIGQFALLALSPADAGLLAVLPTEAGLFGLLVADIISSDHSKAEWALLIGGLLALSTSLLALTATNGLLVAVLVCLAVLAMVSYLLHRYLLLGLGHLSPIAENGNS